ncbi:hypothetical protein R2F25_25050 [Streptomyces sp. UP1A-1]|nr:hypothetical protein [Streptomyces sp. UP1A-1]
MLFLAVLFFAVVVFAVVVFAVLLFAAVVFAVLFFAVADFAALLPTVPDFAAGLLRAAVCVPEVFVAVLRRAGAFSAPASPAFSLLSSPSPLPPEVPAPSWSTRAVSAPGDSCGRGRVSHATAPAVSATGHSTSPAMPSTPAPV